MGTHDASDQHLEYEFKGKVTVNWNSHPHQFPKTTNATHNKCEPKHDQH